jgi:hypothetical protein
MRRESRYKFPRRIHYRRVHRDSDFVLTAAGATLAAPGRW